MMMTSKSNLVFHRLLQHRSLLTSSSSLFLGHTTTTKQPLMSLRSTTTTTSTTNHNSILHHSNNQPLASSSSSSSSSSKPSWMYQKAMMMIKVTAAAISSLTLYACYVEYTTDQMTKWYQYQQQQQQQQHSSHLLSSSSSSSNETEECSTIPIQYTTLPRMYNWDTLNTYWSYRPISTIYRLLQINYYILPLLYKYVQDFIIVPKLHSLLLTSSTNNTTIPSQESKNMTTGSNDPYNVELQHRHAVAWKEVLTQLGPAFIKMGQQISIRPDLVSPIVLQTLQQLCDNVTPISNEVAYTILRKEFNIIHLTDVFVEPPQLVAAASLGQVYRGKLKTNIAIHNNNNNDDGKPFTSPTTTDPSPATNYIDVAIKVQRPGMLESFSLDLFLLQRFSIVVDTFTSIFTNQPPFHKALYESFACGSYSELDYENEAQNQMYFYYEIQKRTLPVIIPKVYTNYTTRTVLTSQWIDGIKLADAPVEQIRALIPIGVELFLTQLLDLGIFHADPHVGNLLVQNTTGQLCLIDYGLCTTVSEKDRRAMTMAIVHILQRDFQTLIHQDSKELGFLPHDCDTTELFPILTKILTVGLLDSPSSNIRVRRRKLLDISNELNDVFFHYPFTVPPYFALITRGLGLLEGIALSGDEDFDIFQAAAPYARRRAMQILYGRISNKQKQNTSTQSPSPSMRSMF